jgi:hypothetical protein
VAGFSLHAGVAAQAWERSKLETWAQRLKRVFNIDVSVCVKCGGEARVIACIEDRAVIDKRLAHLMKNGV